jgi:DNA adenine methylase
MFQKLQAGWIPPTEVSEEEYYSAKDNQENEPWLAGFIGFACSFAGKWWGGYARDGKNGNYALRGHNSILKKMKNLQSAI